MSVLDGQSASRSNRSAWAPAGGRHVRRRARHARRQPALLLKRFWYLVAIGSLLGAFSAPVVSGLTTEFQAGAVVPTCSAASLPMTPLMSSTFYITSLTGSAHYAGYKFTNNTGSPITGAFVKLDSFTGGVVGLAPNQASFEQLPDLAAGASANVYFYLAASGATASAQGQTIHLFNERPDLIGATEICNTTFSYTSVASTITASANKVISTLEVSNPPAIGSIMTMTVQGATGTIGSGLIFDETPAADPTWPANVFELLSAQTTIDLTTAGGVTTTTNNDSLIYNFSAAATPNRNYTIVYTFKIVGPTSSSIAVSPIQEISSGTQTKHTSNTGTSSVAPTLNTTTLAKQASPTTIPAGVATTVTYTVTATNTSSTDDAFLDDFTDTLPADATYIAGTSTFNASTIPDPNISGSTLVWVGPSASGGNPSGWDVPKSGSSTLTYQVTMLGPAGTQSNSVIGHIGTTIIDTTTATNDDVPATSTVTLVALKANDDNYTTPADTTLNVPAPGVMGNDTGVGITVTNHTTPSHGSLTQNADGSLSYVPDSGYSGPDSYQYTITDEFSNTSSATVNITVTPVAVDDHYSTLENTPLTVPAPGILVNDIGLGLTVTTHSTPSHGTLTQNADGSFTYNPDSGFSGTDSYTYVDTDGTSDSNTATVTIVVIAAAPGISVAKSVTSSGPYTTVGQTITYQFVATDTGNTSLTSVGINDTQTLPAGSLTTGPTCVSLSSPSGACSGSTTSLVSGQSATFTATYTITQADLDHGLVADSATASGTPPAQSPITSAPSPASVPMTTTPSITVLKSVTSSGPYDAVGQAVTYQFVATNTGDVTLTSVSIDDTQSAPAGSLTSGPTCVSLSTPSGSCSGPSTTLVPGQSATFTATYDIGQPDLDNGSVHDSATAGGTPPSGPPVTSLPSPATVPMTATPSITVAKTVTSSGPYTTVGQTISYQFVATNTGNVTLSSVTIDDLQSAPAGDLATGPTCVSLSSPAGSCSGSTTTLAPGQSATFTASYTITQADLDNGSVHDSATATGTPPGAAPVTSTPSPVTVPLTTTATITVAKSVTSSGPYNAVGQTITYQFVATNTGNVTLTAVSIDDTQTAPAGSLTTGPTCVSRANPSASCSGSSTTLAPGQTATFTATYTITLADLDNGSVADSATASGTPPGGPPVTSQPSPATVPMAAAPGIGVVKSVTSSGPYTAAGQTITYQFVATNTGNVTLTSVTINDTQSAPAGSLTSGPTCVSLASPAGTCSGSSTTLVPGQSATFTATYTISQADVTNASVHDSATASGMTPPGLPVTSSPSAATVEISIPSLTIAKSVNASVAAPGDTVTYTITVTNAGNVAYGSGGIPLASFTDSLTGVLADATVDAASLTATAGTASVSGSNIEWSGALGVGAKATITYQVKVNSPDTGPHQLTNAVVSNVPGSGCPATGAPAGCSTATPVSDIAALKQVCGSQVATACAAGGSGPWLATTTIPSGGTAYWKITVTNTGQAPLTGVTVSDPLAPSCGTAAGSFDLAVGASMSVYCSNANVTTAITNVATASYPQPNGPPQSVAVTSSGAVATAAVAAPAPPAPTPVTPAPPITG
jgi:uncharacterized repeat protein (TIGR01451 family)